MNAADLQKHGFRMPSPMPPSSSGDAKFDAAIETLRKRSRSLAKRGEPGLPKIPARLAKPKDGDLERLLTLLDANAFDPGASAFDMEKGRDKEYLQAWRHVVAALGEKTVLVAALVGLALRDEGAEEHLGAHMPRAMSQRDFARDLNEAMLACEREISPELLELGLAILAVDGVPRDMHGAWESATKVALTLPPALGVAKLVPLLSTDRRKAVQETLERQPSLDAEWRGPLLELAKKDHEGALRLLTKLPPDDATLDAIASSLQRSGMWAPMSVDYLAKHADEPRLDQLPEALAEAVRKRRS